MPDQPSTFETRTIHSAIIRKIRKALLEWGKVNYQHYSWRQTNNRWLALVAEIMLQRTRAINVIPIFTKFEYYYYSPRMLDELSVENLEKILHPLGLKWRAKFLKKLAQNLKDIEIPTTYKELITLPGVGNYVASAYLSLHGFERAILVDTNTVRFICRFVGVGWSGETRREKWLTTIMENITPKYRWKDFNFALLDFAMTICKKKPDCLYCPLNNLCKYDGKGKNASKSNIRIHCHKETQ